MSATPGGPDTGSDPDRVNAVAAAQASGHGEGFDYVAGSPHLRHDSLRGMVEGRLADLVADITARTGGCRALEIGGGHGNFSARLLRSGATLTVTETSPASAEVLRTQLKDLGSVEVRHDETGEAILGSEEKWDLVVMTAVLHHIPDYLAYLDRLVELIADDGALFTAQDPLYYPRMPRLHHRAQRATYLAWRVAQGEYKRGLATRWRRLRGVYDDTSESDLIEYHVVRDGVDEEAIRAQLAPRFGSVEVFSYWSTQAPIWQRLGERTRMTTDFGIEARGRLAGQSRT